MPAASNQIIPDSSINHVGYEYWSPHSPGTDLTWLDAKSGGNTIMKLDSSAATLLIDLIGELTAAAGVTIDGLLIKDSAAVGDNDTYFLTARNAADNANVDIAKIDSNDILRFDSDNTSSDTATDLKAVPNEYFFVCDSTGGDTFTAAATTVNLDSTPETNGSQFSIASDVLTINKTGVYDFDYKATAELNSGSGDARWTVQLEKDSGGGYSVVTQVKGAGYDSGVSNTFSEANGFTTLSVTSGDKFRLRAIRVDGTSTLATVADGSGLRVKRIS